MTNLKNLETLRNKEELIEFFEKQGRKITEEEIANLKKQYLKSQNNDNCLTFEQLDNIAGGIELMSWLRANRCTVFTMLIGLSLLGSATIGLGCGINKLKEAENPKS